MSLLYRHDDVCNSFPTTITIPKPADLHLHLREGDMLYHVTPLTADQCSFGLIMPNTNKPIRLADELEEYRGDILDAARPSLDFNPLMTFKILPDTKPETIPALKRAGAIAGKIYPRGVTTNAQDGVERYSGLHEVLLAMQEEDLVLCLHGEKPGRKTSTLKREEKFLRTLRYLAANYPRLRIVMEHITTAAAVKAVLELPITVAATITAHHLYLTLEDVMGDKLYPHNFCKPVAKLPSDRAALNAAAMSGNPKFFFGSDSAPHPQNRKECEECCAGVFTGPIVPELVTERFVRAGKWNMLAAFYRIPDRYPLPTLTLVNKPMQVPLTYKGVVPFKAGKKIAWSIVQ